VTVELSNEMQISCRPSA